MENSNFFERILQIIESENIKNVSVFAKEYLGYKSPEKINRLKKKEAKPSYDILADISNRFDKINIRWLLTVCLSVFQIVVYFHSNANIKKGNEGGNVLVCYFRLAMYRASMISRVIINPRLNFLFLILLLSIVCFVVICLCADCIYMVSWRMCIMLLSFNQLCICKMLLYTWARVVIMPCVLVTAGNCAMLWRINMVSRNIRVSPGKGIAMVSVM